MCSLIWRYAATCLFFVVTPAILCARPSGSNGDLRGFLRDVYRTADSLSEILQLTSRVEFLDDTCRVWVPNARTFDSLCSPTGREVFCSSVEVSPCLSEENKKILRVRMYLESVEGHMLPQELVLENLALVASAGALAKYIARRAFFPVTIRASSQNVNPKLASVSRTKPHSSDVANHSALPSRMNASLDESPGAEEHPESGLSGSSDSTGSLNASDLLPPSDFAFLPVSSEVNQSDVGEGFSEYSAKPNGDQMQLNHFANEAIEEDPDSSLFYLENSHNTPYVGGSWLPPPPEDPQEFKEFCQQNPGLCLD